MSYKSKKLIEKEQALNDAYHKTLDDMYWRGKYEIHYYGKLNFEKELEDGMKVLKCADNLRKFKKNHKNKRT